MLGAFGCTKSHNGTGAVASDSLQTGPASAPQTSPASAARGTYTFVKTDIGEYGNGITTVTLFIPPDRQSPFAFTGVFIGVIDAGQPDDESVSYDEFEGTAVYNDTGMQLVINDAPALFGGGELNMEGVVLDSGDAIEITAMGVQGGAIEDVKDPDGSGMIFNRTDE